MKVRLVKCILKKVCANAVEETYFGRKGDFFTLCSWNCPFCSCDFRL
jgi:hypothetical protein